MWLHQLGEAPSATTLCRRSISCSRSNLIFGIILVLMMLYRRDGLIPAHRKASALTFEAAACGGGARAPRSRCRASRRRPRRGKPLLEVNGVTVRFGGLVALNAMTLTVPEGGVLAVIGPNGSGKSTLFNVITGLTPRGRRQHPLRRDGDARPAIRTGSSRRDVARTFQNIRLFPNLSVMDNVLVGAAQPAAHRPDPRRAAPAADPVRGDGWRVSG